MDELKKIIATFVKKDPSEIDDHTLINKRVIAGSILVHRMYAAINNAGYSVKDYNDINTYGALLARLNGTSVSPSYIAPNLTQIYSPAIQTVPKGIGIDIENISGFPNATDFREDSFYKLNFSMQEISYCILNGKPLESFAGMFSAKEALCKANEQIRNIPFNLIEIKHDDNGKPTYPGYSISISHTDQFAIAIAIASEPEKPTSPVNAEIMRLSEKYDRKIATLKRMVFFSVFIAMIAVAISIILLSKAS